MSKQRVLQFEYLQSLVQDSDRSGWSEKVTVSIRLLSEAITSGWYRNQFASRGNDFVILLAIAMHARPLNGADLQLLVNLHMAKPSDEGRLYARVSDVALADELGMSRITIARATRRLADDKSLSIMEIPEKITAFRDSHGRYNGNKVYLIAGDMQGRLLEKSIEKVNCVTKSSSVDLTGDRNGVIKSSSDDVHQDIKRARHLPNLCINVKDEKDDGEETSAFIKRVFSYFAQRKVDPDYHPTIKEQIALEKLIRDGFTFEQIIAGIDVAFIRPSRPRYFTHCAAITRDLVRLQQDSRTPVTRQPENHEPEALQESLQPEFVPAEVIETPLARAVEVYRSCGREINNDLLARFRLMAARCNEAAVLAGATGGDWLADALSRALGVAQPGSLINYADAVLDDWIINGHNDKPARRTFTPKSTLPDTVKVVQRGKAGREPAAHAGIREYLENHGEIHNGNRD